MDWIVSSDGELESVPRRTFTARQERLYAWLDWGRGLWPYRGRLRPWTLRSAYYRLVGMTDYWAWHNQRAHDAYVADAAKKLSDKIDAEVLRLFCQSRHWGAKGSACLLKVVTPPRQLPPPTTTAG